MEEEKKSDPASADKSSDRFQYSEEGNAEVVIWNFIKNRFLEVAFLAGLILCFPEPTKEFGMLGFALAISSAVLMAGRNIAKAIREKDES